MECSDTFREMREVATPANTYSNVIEFSGDAPEDPLNNEKRDLATASSMENNNEDLPSELPYKVVTATDRLGERFIIYERTFLVDTIYDMDFMCAANLRSIIYSFPIENKTVHTTIGNCTQTDEA